MPCFASLRPSLLLLLSGATLAACTGGGGGSPGPQTAPPPPSSPVPGAPDPIAPDVSTPAPPTPQPDIDFNTAEYRTSSAAIGMQALPAYSAGASGAGVTVAIIDSGIDLDSPEFSGRIHPASRDIVANRTAQDVDGHGTFVASIIGAARNESGIHGVAYEARLLAARTDMVGSCTTGCLHSDAAIASALDLATSSGARVVNISLGGIAANNRLSNALRTATQAGVIVVISAGNDAGLDPDMLAQVALRPDIAQGQIIIAGAVNASGTLSSFSNRAGIGRDHYVAAPGERLNAPDENGILYSVSGTSFAAASISGALAVLLQAFPTLSAQQAVQLLFDTATDAGDVGDDAVYGQGVVNLARAFLPQGQASLASGIPVPLSGALAHLGPAFGDGGGLAEALRQVAVIDRYGRSFTLDLSNRLAPASARLGLVDRLDSRRAWAGGGSTTLGWRAQLTPLNAVPVWRHLALTEGRDAQTAQPGPTLGWWQPTDRLSFGLANSMSGEALRAHSQQRPRPASAFLLDSGTGLENASALSKAVALRWQGNGSSTDPERWGISVSAQTARPALDPHPSENRRNPTSSLAVALDWQRANSSATLTVGQQDSRSGMLGSTATAALGLAGPAQTQFATLTGAYHFPDQTGRVWQLGGALETSRSILTANNQGLLTDFTPVLAYGWSATLATANLTGSTDALGLRLSQPLRVESASAALTGSRQTIALNPTGREVSLEASYQRPLVLGVASWGTLSANLYHRQDAGHQSGLTDSGLLAQWGIHF